MNHGDLFPGVAGVAYAKTCVNAGQNGNTLRCGMRCGLGVPYSIEQVSPWLAATPGETCHTPGIPSGVAGPPAPLLVLGHLPHLPHRPMKTWGRP